MNYPPWETPVQITQIQDLTCFSSTGWTVRGGMTCQADSYEVLRSWELRLKPSSSRTQL